VLFLRKRVLVLSRYPFSAWLSCRFGEPVSTSGSRTGASPVPDGRTANEELACKGNVVLPELFKHWL